MMTLSVCRIGEFLSEHILLSKSSDPIEASEVPPAVHLFSISSPFKINSSLIGQDLRDVSKMEPYFEYQKPHADPNRGP